MNHDQHDEYQSKDTILNALLIGGMAVGCAVLAVAQNVPGVFA